MPLHHWVGKLLGFDFIIEYKASAANMVADALSCHDKEEESINFVVLAP